MHVELYSPPRPLHVAVDMDDVVVDFWQGVYAAIALEFGIELPPSQGWDKNPVKEFEGFGKGGFWGWMRERDWIWSTFKPIPGAIGGIRRLRQTGHFVELLTSKPPWAEPQVFRWLGKWRPPVNQVTIMRTDDQTKAEASNAEVLVDDKPENCLSFVDAGRWALLFDQPHNRYYEPVNGARLLRVSGWEQTLTAIETQSDTGVLV